MLANILSIILAAAKDNMDCWEKCKQDRICITSVMNLKTSACYLHRMAGFDFRYSDPKSTMAGVCFNINLTVSNSYCYFLAVCIKDFFSADTSVNMNSCN